MRAYPRDEDATLSSRIGHLVNEEHRLLEWGRLTDEESQRLEGLQADLDRCWELMRQRRAPRGLGGHPPQMRARNVDAVRGYIG